MKGTKYTERKRCLTCGCFLYNYDSLITGHCKDHRPELPQHILQQWRKTVRDKLGSPTKTDIVPPSPTPKKKKQEKPE